MTKDEAKTIEDAARKWADCVCEHELNIVLHQDNVLHSDLVHKEQAFLALLNSMIEEPKK